MTRRKIPYGTTEALTGNAVEEREIVYDTTLGRLAYGDGVSPAGVPVAKKSETDALDARVSDLEAAPTTVPTFGGIYLSATYPTIALQETDQAANNKLWWTPFVDGNVAYFGPVNDALSQTVAFSISRSAVTNFAVAPTFTDATTTRSNLGVYSTAQVDAAITAHAAAGDPHPAYLLEASFPTYLTLGTTTTVAIGNVPRWVDFEGAGVASLTISDSILIAHDNGATGSTDVYSFGVLRRANYTGGSGGFVNSAARFETYASAGVTAYEWTGVFLLDNSGTSGDGSENVALYMLSHKRSTGKTWGAVIELIDYLADPAASSVGLELDMSTTGTDASTQRVGLDLWARPRTGSTSVTYGLRFNSDTNATLTNALYFNAGAGGSITNFINSSSGNFIVTAAGALTARSGAFTRNHNGATDLQVSNTNVHASATAQMRLTSDAGTFSLVQNSTLASLFPSLTVLTAPSGFILNATSGASLAHNGTIRLATSATGVAVTGSASFSDAATTRTNLGIGSADVPTFGGLYLSAAYPTVSLQETDQSANNKLWWTPFVDGNVAYFGPVSDALSQTVAFSINRSAVTNFAVAPTFSNASGTRTNLGLGTAATVNTGTSGAAIPLLNGTNTWANTQQFATARFGDSNFQISLSTDAYIYFDSSDYIRYDRGSNVLWAYIAGTAITAVGATGFGPAGDNTFYLGNGFARWKEVFAVAGLINTSDAREKSDFVEASPAVFEAVAAVFRRAGMFQWKHAVAEKGAAARWHFGNAAQWLHDELEARGEDASRYGLYCVSEREVDGVKQTRVSQRPDQLHAIAITDLYRKQDDIENRVKALEALAA